MRTVFSLMLYASPLVQAKIIQEGNRFYDFYRCIALKRNWSKFDISSIVKNVPVEKLDELQNVILNAVEKAKAK